MTPQQRPGSGFRLERPSRQWVDLFYDLAIAAGIIDLAGAYSHDASPSGAAWLALTYGVLWCTWLLTSAVSGSFEHSPRPHSAPTVVVLVAQMGVILFLAVASGDSAAEEAGGFDLLLGIALVFCLMLALPAWRAGRVSGRAVLLVVVAVLALGASYIVPDDPALVVWLGAFAAVGAAVWLVASGAELDSHRVLHRLGELTVIVIGETLVKLVLTASEHSVASVHVAAIVPILAILAAIWWSYFGALSHVKDLERSRRHAWIVVHLPLHLALLGISVGLAKLLIADASLGKPWGALTLVFGPVAAAFLALAGLALIARRGRAAALLAGGAAGIALVAVGCGLAFSAETTAFVVAAASVVVAATSTLTPSTKAAVTAAD